MLIVVSWPELKPIRTICISLKTVNVSAFYTSANLEKNESDFKDHNGFLVYLAVQNFAF